MRYSPARSGSAYWRCYRSAGPRWACHSAPRGYQDPARRPRNRVYGGIVKRRHSSPVRAEIEACALNVRSVVGSVSRIVAVFGALMLAPVAVSLVFGESDWKAFLISSIVTAAIGVVGTLLAPPGTDQRIGNREGMAITTLGWTACALFGALPFLLAALCARRPMPCSRPCRA